MTDETMITRVARAMQDRRNELIAQPLSRVWEELAKAGIEAMKPATPAMLDRGADGMAYTQDMTFAVMCKYAWLEMIDAALEEGK